MMNGFERLAEKFRITEIGDGLDIALELPIFVDEVDYQLVTSLLTKMGEFALLKRDGALFLAYRFCDGFASHVRLDDYLVEDVAKLSREAFERGQKVRVAMTIVHRGTVIPLGLKTMLLSHDLTRMLHFESERQENSPPSMRQIECAWSWMARHVRDWESALWHSICSCEGES